MSSNDDSSEDLVSALDPRHVLAYLNELGIRNVNSAMLKEFIKDLKKLIRLDQQRNNQQQGDNKENLVSKIGPERLHSCSTYSSRCKSVNVKEQRRKPLSSSLSELDTVKSDIRTNNVCKRVCSATVTERCRRVKMQPTASACTVRSTPNIFSSAKSSNLIKVPMPEKQKKSDPVALYHYYNSLWEKYKSHLPGENSWADLRWSVRERLLGAVPEKTKPIMSTQSKEMLAKRREGWID